MKKYLIALTIILSIGINQVLIAGTFQQDKKKETPKKEVKKEEKKDDSASKSKVRKYKAPQKDK